MASLTPLPGNALGGIGNLIKRRRGIAGSAFGKAANTQPQGPPTNPISDESGPLRGIGSPSGIASAHSGLFGSKGLSSTALASNVAGGPFGSKNLVPGSTVTTPSTTIGAETGSQFQPGRTGVGNQVEVSPGRFYTPRGGGGSSGPETPAAPAPIDNSGLAARLGAESIARSRKKNRQQQAALSSQAMR